MSANDISATCVTRGRCPTRHVIFRGQDAVYDRVGGGWRHADCTACVPMPDCANCGKSAMAHGGLNTCPGGAAPGYVPTRKVKVEDDGHEL